MKIKSDFVTNSSSSSFVIGLPKAPENIEEVMMILFGKDMKYDSFHQGGYSSNAVSCVQIAETFLSDINSGGQATLARVAKELTRGHQSGMPDYDSKEFLTGEMKNGHPVMDWNKYNMKLNEFAMTKAVEFMGKNPDYYYVVVEYEDDTTLGSTMEHGGVFDTTYHIRISNH